MKILVVEDERALQNALVKGLKNLGYIVNGASDGQEALDMFFSDYYDLIVLDLNLPYIDGIDILKEIRNDNHDVRIIILSARSEVEDKVIGLDLGANDFLEKPFHFKELNARINNLLRREFVQHDSVIKIQDYQIDTLKKNVIYNNEIVNLTKKEYQILEYLVVNKNQILSNQQLIDHLWENDDIDYSVLKVHLNNLRKKLPTRLILNKRNEGYYVE